MGCDRLGSSHWTQCMLKGSFKLAGWVTTDFLRLGEGHDTEGFAQSCKQRVLERVVLESLGLAGAQQPPPTAAEYRVRPTSLWMLYNIRLCTYGATIHSFTSWVLRHTVHWPFSHTSCILTSTTFCFRRDITCRTPPSESPLFTVTVVSQREKSQKCLKCFSGLECGCPADRFSCCRLNRKHSWVIVQVGRQSDSDPKRANRAHWWSRITAQR